jgi:hypothetical protein
MSDESTINVTISRDAAFDFITQLAEDDEVRAAVAARPAEELAERGIDIGAQLVPAEAKLASKEQFTELLVLLGDDPADKFGRPKGEAWHFHLLCFVFMFGALPFVEREALRDGAR